MLPWNYGFHWNTATVMFMGAFYSVICIVAATVVNAALRARRTLRAERAEHVRWHSDFGELSPQNRACRHAISDQLPDRLCGNEFDCRACQTHRKLTNGAVQLSATGDPEDDDLFGLSFPADRFYHRGHTWVHPEPDGTVTIGLDDIGQRLLVNPERIDLPAPGERLMVNGPAWRARKRNADVRVLSPVDGEVVATGGPDSGWYLKVKPLSPDFRHLLGPSEVKAWVMRELERLQLALSVEGSAFTLADGGVPVADIAAGYPEADWDGVCARMFLHP